MARPDNVNTLIVIVGPTAVGKTSLAIKVAKHFQCEIVSADSRQVYREMNLGTAKPDKAELQEVPHHFINTHSIEEDFSAGTFERDALSTIEALHQQNQYAVLVGGSGLYVKAITDGLAEMPSIPPEVRQNLNQQLENEGLDMLLLELKEADPEYYELVDKNNPQRVLRALEVYRFTRQPYSDFRVPEQVQRPFQSIKIGLTMDRDKLYERIDQRMDQMIENGLFEEAESLLSKRYFNALQTVGYTEIFDYLEGKYDKTEAIRLLKRNSRRYAKRQLTWFSKDEEVKWFNPSEIGKITIYIDSVVTKE